MTYHVLPLGVTIVVIYIFTLYLSYSGFTARLSHRRFWNWILLGSFIVTALFGLFLALKITYRWDVPSAESIKHWHVEAGIAMAFAAIIHLSWHLGYYFRKVRRQSLAPAGAEGKGAEGKGAEGTGAEGTGAEGTGTEGKGTEGTGAEGTGAEGTGAEGTGAEGTGTEGNSAVSGELPAQDSPEDDSTFSAGADLPAGRYRLLLLLIGFVSSASQFIMMREAVILGGGTEAVAGLFLWLWLVIAAGGALTGGRSAITSLRRMVGTLIAGTSLAPVMLVMMTTVILSPGETPSFLQTLVILAVSVAPVTFISALIFVRLSVIRQATGISGPGNSFGTETAGSVAAGIVTALTVAILIPNFKLYMLILLLASLSAAWLLSYPRRTSIAATAFIIMAGALLFVFPPDPAIRGLLLRGVTVESSTDTPFGNITTGLYGDELTVYYDHRPLFFSGDVITTEENIHFALLQREKNERVLLISGGLKRHLGELVKHEVAELVYLEPDPGLIAAEGARDTVCGTMNVRVISSDPVTFLRGDGENYDAIIQLIPPHATLSFGRFYTAEYFRTVREQLTAGGIFMCTPMAWFNYSPESYRKGFSPLFNALSNVFSHVTLIPGSSLYVIASDRPVSSEIALLADKKGIGNSYVNSDYIDDPDIKIKKEQILSQVDRKAAMNTATRPVSSFFANILSIERMGMKGGIIVLLVVMMTVPFAFVARKGMIMFTSAASLACFGMIIIFILQMAVGNIYILSAVILTLLMAGLATGAVLGERLALKSVMLCAFLLTVIYTVTGLLAPTLTTSAPYQVLIFLFIVLPSAGLITGAIYRILTTHNPGGITARVYAADMAGSALGYLTAATLLVPLAGIANACFILAAVILITGTVASVAIKQ